MKISDLLPRGGKEHQPLLQALDDRVDNRISEKEFIDTCYRWAYAYALKGSVYQRLPIKPVIVEEFGRMTESKRKRIFEEDSQIRLAVETYRTNVAGVKHANKRNYEYLLQMEKYFKDEPEKLVEIRSCIMNHKREGME